MKNKKITFILFIAIISIHCLLQHSVRAADLPRKVVLGIRMKPINESHREKYNYTEDHGIFIPQVISGGSFAGMGVTDSVFLQQINGKTINSTDEVLKALETIRAGEKMEVVVVKNGTTYTHTGNAIGKPKSTHPLADIQYGSVSYPGNELRSLLYLPHAVENPPVVFFLQGYTCQSVEVPDWNPVSKLTSDWIEAGFAVFMVEKPGMGDSQSEIPCMETDFNQELNAFSEAYKDLRENPLVDGDNIFLFGHSMGGVIAPLLSNLHKPAGVMVFGIMGKNWYDYMLDIFTEQRKLFGASEEDIQNALQYDQPFIHDMLVEKKNNLEIINDPNYGDHLKQNGIAAQLEEGYYLQRHYTFWQTLADIDIPETWSKVKVPVYVMHGEYDIQAINPRFGEMIAINVNEHGGNAKFELIPHTEHAFLKFDSMEQNIESRTSGTYRDALANRYNPDVAKLSISWMKEWMVK